MRASDECLALIMAWEGIEDGDPSTVNLEPYVCPANIYTVGYGHALTTGTGKLIDIDVFGADRARQLAGGAMMREFGRSAITFEEAEDLLYRDLEIYEIEVRDALGSAGATQGQFDALVSFCFNVGGPNLRSSSVLRLHNAGHRDVEAVVRGELYAAAREKHSISNIQIAFVRWCNADGRFMLGLFRRRLSEVLIYSGHDAATALRFSQSYPDA